MARILVAEDDPGVREFVVGVLEEHHDVISATGGMDALAIVEDRSVGIDLLLTDIVMPDLNGVALSRMAALRRRGLAVLYMTGFAEVALERAGQLLGTVLYKPFRAEALLAAVADALPVRNPG
jgi:DNA-binding NtrC family response regulator